ncbi:hypothetical protein Pmar_PMAR009645 [Perkinsus marinus ATCC 50983]|uniref:K Homology domain-containing protein n=1 Tax=Perkinsus marinus (strain ATCC 50983 / TXsc) TaxID=423536 RepID=C5LWT3_PERM5|nr:hypothetical protein Pmar_PMAR009645 [Perkinsus marinus ATCC 50983]EEQ98808.1 hypothetical protein Pmar_PMAR009645 [Perkinsus marinus ATCC 50983]|eukprot:XP_002766091.1 hypothetical protein Pmar_PMAR009645 [Perkinsus marinus ATCC 50983]
MSPSPAQQTSSMTATTTTSNNNRVIPRAPSSSPWSAAAGGGGGAWGSDTMSAQQLMAVGADISGENLAKLMAFEKNKDEKSARGMLVALSDPDLAELKMRAVNSLESVVKDTSQVHTRMMKLESSIKALAAEAKSQQKEHEQSAARATTAKSTTAAAGHSSKRSASRSIGPSIGSKLKDLQLEFSKLGKKKADCIAHTKALEIAKVTVEEELDCRDTCASLKLPRGRYEEMRLVIPAEKVQRSRGRNGANFRRLANQFGVLVDEVEQQQQPQQQYSQSDATGGSGDEGGPLIVKIRGEKKRVADCYAELKHEVCEEIRYYRDLDNTQLQAMAFFAKYIEKEIEERYEWVSCRLVVMFKEKQVLMKLADMGSDDKQKTSSGRTDSKLRNVFDRVKRAIADRLNGYSTVELTARNQASVIIGRGGQNIEKLRVETGCFLYIENPSGVSTRQSSPSGDSGDAMNEAQYGSLRIIGKKKDLSAAKDIVMKFVESQKRSTLVWRLDEEVDAEDLIECIWDRRTVKRDPAASFGNVVRAPCQGCRANVEG